MAQIESTELTAPTHRSAEDRVAVGKRARAASPRRGHAEFAPAAGRPDPVEVLEGQATTRVSELIPIRYGRMLVSAFTFYRGGAALMAGDLAATPHTDLQVQLCGDAHLSNFGVFAAPDRRLVFSVNDFDETLPGPFEWDVKRLVASFAVAGRDRGFDAKQRKVINRAVVRAYRESMHDFAGMRNIDIWFARLDLDDIARRMQSFADAKQLRRFDRNVAKAHSKDSLRAFGKLTTMVDGEPRIVADHPVITPVEDLMSPEERARVHERAAEIIGAYRDTLPDDRRRLMEEYRYVHAARKVVGVGSVGTRAWILLLLGRDGQDPLFLQAKEAQESVLERFVGKSKYPNCGQRVVAGQRLMQAASDIFLGWQRVPGFDGQSRDFYIRQLRDWKGSADVDTMTASGMAWYARLCGATLARAHARSGDRIAIASYLGNGDVFDKAIADFSAAYADQNERDYQTLLDAVKSGRIAAQTGL